VNAIRGWKKKKKKSTKEEKGKKKRNVLWVHRKNFIMEDQKKMMGRK